MSTRDAEAYVIEKDGTKTAIPVQLVDEPHADNGSSGRNAGAAPFARGFSCGGAKTSTRETSSARGARSSAASTGPQTSNPYANAYGYAPQSPFTTVDAQTVAPKRSLHLGRRVAGLAIAAVGVPLLILPGPGLALIGLGLLMATMP